MEEILVVVYAIKLLLFPAYFSTDFDVHRNWLAVTSSLPISQWYVDDTSQWTLDYPPFFAWFEWIMSLFASLIAPEALEITSGVIQTSQVILFQRISVLVSEIALVYVLLKIWKVDKSSLILILLNFGLVMVDNVHFQYNGILLSLLLLSYKLMEKGDMHNAGFVFAILLNFKHLFMYMAPVYFIYLLRHHIAPLRVQKLMYLGSGVLIIFGISVLPFDIPQMLSRLFPFKRGLVHAYWAPNIWALYCFADAVLSLLFTGRFTTALMSGLVQENDFTVLPEIRPWMTLLATLVAMAPLLIKVWKVPSSARFIDYATVGAMSFIMFGWHVHEKAWLMISIPWVLTRHPMAFATNVLVGFSLFPLVYPVGEAFFKVLLFIGFVVILYRNLAPTLSRIEIIYMLLAIPVWVLYSIFPSGKFYPLMLVSVYCSIGLIYIYINSYIRILKQNK